MGFRVPNAELVEDHATKGKDSCIRLHMDLPIPYDQAPEYRRLLENDAWDEVAIRLASQNPQQGRIIEDFLKAAGVRKHGESKPHLRAVGGAG